MKMTWNTSQNMQQIRQRCCQVKLVKIEKTSHVTYANPCLAI